MGYYEELEKEFAEEKPAITEENAEKPIEESPQENTQEGIKETENNESAPEGAQKDEPKPFDIKTWFTEKGIEDFEEENFPERWSSLKTKAEEAETLKAELQRQKDLLEAADDEVLKKYDIKEDDLKFFLIRKEFPDMDSKMLSDVITKDYSKKYKEDPMEVLALRYMLKDGDIFDSKEAALTQVYQDFGIDTDNTDDNGKLVITDIQKRSMQKAAKEAIREFDTIKSKVALPDKTNMIANQQKAKEEAEKKLNRIKDEWQPTFKTLADKVLGKLKFERNEKDGEKSKVVSFEYDIDDDFRREATKSLSNVLDTLATRGIEYTKESEKELVETLRKDFREKYIGKNFDRIWTARENQLIKEWSDKEHQELHNPRIDGRVAPQPPKKKEDQENEDFQNAIGNYLGRY